MRELSGTLSGRYTGGSASFVELDRQLGRLRDARDRQAEAAAHELRARAAAVELARVSLLNTDRNVAEVSGMMALDYIRPGGAFVAGLLARQAARYAGLYLDAVEAVAEK